MGTKETIESMESKKQECIRHKGGKIDSGSRSRMEGEKTERSKDKITVIREPKILEN
jgi:hypothetical protein